MACLFDFDLKLVARAMGNDYEAVNLVLERLYAKVDQINRRIMQLCPDWPTEHRERILDLFIHDRFLKVLKNPPKGGIEDFNALCWKMLWSSISDAYRFYRAEKRSVLLEQSGDEPGYGKDGLSTFWEAHSAELLFFQGQSRGADWRAEISDFMRQVNGHLSLMSKKKRLAINMWAAGFTEREIASRLGLTIGNAGSIISRVISELRKKICKNGG